MIYLPDFKHYQQMIPKQTTKQLQCDVKASEGQPITEVRLRRRT